MKAKAISATPRAIGSAAFVMVTVSKTSSATRDLTSPPQCAISFTREFWPNMSVVMNGECHVVISTSAFAISVRNCGESSRDADRLQLATLLSLSKDSAVKKCWNKTSLANTRTFGRVTSLPNNCAHRLHEIRQRDVRFFDLGSPILLPFETDEAVVVQGCERSNSFRKRNAASTCQHRQPVFRARDRLCIPEMNVREMRLNSPRRGLNLVTCGQRIRDVPNQFHPAVIGQRNDLRRAFRSRVIAVGLEGDVDALR